MSAYLLPVGGAARWRPWYFGGVFLVLLLLLLLLCLPLHAQTAGGAPSEDAVKAVYLFKLHNYVAWPYKSAETPTVVAVVGAEEVAEHLDEMPAVRQRSNEGVVIKRLRVGDATEGVHVLFVGDAYWSRAGAMVARASAHGVLVVSDVPGGLPAGSAMNFRLVEERLRFDVSLDAADKAGLKFSSQLLALALSVSRERQK
jgi:hypothetical protein